MSSLLRRVAASPAPGVCRAASQHIFSAPPSSPSFSSAARFFSANADAEAEEEEEGPANPLHAAEASVPGSPADYNTSRAQWRKGLSELRKQYAEEAAAVADEAARLRAAEAAKVKEEKRARLKQKLARSAERKLVVEQERRAMAEEYEAQRAASWIEEIVEFQLQGYSQDAELWSNHCHMERKFCRRL